MINKHKRNCRQITIYDYNCVTSRKWKHW